MMRVCAHPRRRLVAPERTRGLRARGRARRLPATFIGNGPVPRPCRRRALRPISLARRRWRAAALSIIDLRPSLAYRQGHIAGAIWSIRPRLGAVAAVADKTVLLVAEEPAIAAAGRHRSCRKPAAGMCGSRRSGLGGMGGGGPRSPPALPSQRMQRASIFSLHGQAPRGHGRGRQRQRASISPRGGRLDPSARRPGTRSLALLRAEVDWLRLARLDVAYASLWIEVLPSMRDQLQAGAARRVKCTAPTS